MMTTTSVSIETVLQNIVIILSNVAFLMPAVKCLELKKHVQAFVYFSVFTTSSLYHTCKFGANDFASPEGICFILDFDSYFRLDHIFAMLTIPCLLLSFAPLDMVIFDFTQYIECDGGGGGEKNNQRGEEKEGVSKRYQLAKNKKEMKQFLFDAYFSVDTSLSTLILNDITVNINASVNTNGGDELINKQNILSFYKRFAGKFIVKKNMVGLENIYVCMYAYLIAVSLLISYPNMFFTAALCLSSLFISCFWGLYYYINHGVTTVFRGYSFWFGLALAIVACILMLIQDHLPDSTYWVTHSIWHICGAIGHYLLLTSKYRYSYYYYY